MKASTTVVYFFPISGSVSLFPVACITYSYFDHLEIDITGGPGTPPQ
jgi:hypothetical protein